MEPTVYFVKSDFVAKRVTYNDDGDWLYMLDEEEAKKRRGLDGVQAMKNHLEQGVLDSDPA